LSTTIDIEQRNKKIVAEALQGEKFVDIARRYGISAERVRQIAAKAGDPSWCRYRQRSRTPRVVYYDPHSPDPIERRNAEIVKARKEGTASIYELADRYGISAERVRQIAAKGGVDGSQAADAYLNNKRKAEFERAKANQDVIFMRYIAGDRIEDIAKAFDLPVKATQEFIDEMVTDDVIAARYANITRLYHPQADPGPRETSRQSSADRYWTPERCKEALIKLARENGNLLPSSTQYQRIAPDRDDLPSFATIRNRLGRWTFVRADIHRALAARSS